MDQEKNNKLANGRSQLKKNLKEWCILGRGRVCQVVDILSFQERGYSINDSAADCFSSYQRNDLPFFFSWRGDSVEVAADLHTSS